MNNTTLDYYNHNAEGFTSGTLDVQFTAVQDRFLGYLAPGARILDYGCGSGRDSRYFLSKGYQVEACDGSEEMVKIATKTAGIAVKQMLFEELDETARYDGIFACASILHVPSKALPDIFRRLKRAVKKDGIVYVSFKYGTFEGERNGRYFTDLTEEGLQIIVTAADPAHPFVVVDQWISGDARPGRADEKWLNAILQ